MNTTNLILIIMNTNHHSIVLNDVIIIFDLKLNLPLITRKLQNNNK